jgi:hypothetical protein
MSPTPHRVAYRRPHFLKGWLQAWLVPKMTIWPTINSVPHKYLFQAC